jgi:hypothetical protein
MTISIKRNRLASIRVRRRRERGPLGARIENGAMVVTLPLAVADMLLIDR